jgi:osmotically-inducible protein OsmY
VEAANQSDAQRRRAIEEAFHWEPQVGDADRVDDARMTRRGTQRYSDAEVARAVDDSLRFHVWVPLQVRSTVENGWVTLTGDVKWDFQHSAARQAVTFVPGVVGISNHVTVASESRPATRK